MRGVLSVISLACLLSFTSTALAQPWCHVFFQSATGETLAIDYQVKQASSPYYGTFQYLDNIYLHVSGQNLNGDQDVRFVVLNPNVTGDNTFGTMELDAIYDSREERYTVKVRREFPIRTQYGAKFRLETAVVIDGRWLKVKDVHPETSNFIMAAWEHPTGCHNPY